MPAFNTGPLDVHRQIAGLALFVQRLFITAHGPRQSTKRQFCFIGEGFHDLSWYRSFSHGSLPARGQGRTLAG